MKSSSLKRTIFHHRHLSLGAKMVDFAGWEMPLNYAPGIVQEHLATRRGAGLFDVSHMGRFLIRGRGAAALLNFLLTNNCRLLSPPELGAQYTLMADEGGRVVDDCFLYRFDAEREEFLLVVNAANAQKDWEHIRGLMDGYRAAAVEDVTDRWAMLSIQGPMSQRILEGLGGSDIHRLMGRGSVIQMTLTGVRALVARTGYTGEPIGFEIFVDDAEGALRVWDSLIEAGAVPVGLGARDTLRLEACLPLYGHEYGMDLEGKEIPALAFPKARYAVDLCPERGDFLGRDALERQREALEGIKKGHLGMRDVLPRLIRPVAVLDRGVARRGDGVLKDEELIGHITSGTAVPYWEFREEGGEEVPSDHWRLRSIGMAYVDCAARPGDEVRVEVRGRALVASIVERHLLSSRPPYAVPVPVHSA